MADTDITQQATSNVPASDLVGKLKNPNRVAAGKAIAEKRRQAREEQKEKLAEADAIVAKEAARKAQEEARKAQELVEVPE